MQGVGHPGRHVHKGLHRRILAVKQQCAFTGEYYGGSDVGRDINSISSICIYRECGNGTGSIDISECREQCEVSERTGVLGTTNGQTLTLGAVGTGNIVLAPNGTTALTAAGANLFGAGTFTATGLITGNNGLTVSTGNITFSGLNTNNNTVLTTNGQGC